MKNMNSSVLKKLLSTLCIVLILSVVFATTIKNVTAESEDKDTDDDGLSDWQEAALYDTNWKDPDCDDDGLKDGEEINTYKTDPNNPDTDGDRILDGYNVTLDISDSHEYYLWLSDDWQNKYYHDGYTFLGELSYGCNANNRDTDNDDMRDGWEAYYGTKPAIADANEDYDYDNLTNIQEYQNKTHPTNPDTDFDGLMDFDEIVMGTSPLCDDSDNDGLIDGIDNQPMAWWDMDWKLFNGSLPGIYTYRFAILTKYEPKHYAEGHPSDEEVITALKKYYSKDVNVKKITYVDYNDMPSEIKPAAGTFAENKEPRFEYLFNITASHLSDVSEEYYYTNLSWVLEPDADQKINFQVTFEKSLNDMFGFVVNLYRVNGTGYDDVPYSTLYGVGRNLTEDNRSYDVSVQIPWNCVPLVSPKEVLIGLRPIFINYDLNASGRFENVNLSSLNVSEFGLKIASVQAEVVKNPHLLAVRPDLNFEDFRDSLPNNIFTFYGSYSYVYNKYRIECTYIGSQHGFWGPVCLKNITNETTGKFLGFVVVGKFLTDVENYKNSSSYLWSGLNPEKLPVVNMSMGYDHNTVFVKGLVDEVNDTVVCLGNPSIVRPRSVTNSTQIFVFNDTILDVYFYVRYDLGVMPQSPNVECLSKIQGFAVGTKVYERMWCSKSLPVSQNLSWIGSVIKGNVSSFAVIVLTGEHIFIGLYQNSSVSLSVYGVDASLLVGNIVIKDHSSLPPEILAMLRVLGLAGAALGKVGIVLSVILFCIEIYLLVMDFNNAQSGEFKVLYGIYIAREVTYFVTTLLLTGLLTMVGVPAPVAYIISIFIVYGIMRPIVGWLVDTGYFDLDTPTGVVLNYFALMYGGVWGILIFMESAAEQQEKKIRETINSRLCEWIRNRRDAGYCPLIIR